MRPSEILSTFRARLRTAGVLINQSPPADSIRTMLAFYEADRVEGCDVAADADMLSFQWGTYDFGSGGAFELGLTRQVVLPANEDNETTFHLHLTYRFIPTEALTSLGEGKRWCRRPSELAELRGFIESTAAYKAVAQEKPQGVTVDYEGVGE